MTSPTLILLELEVKSQLALLSSVDSVDDDDEGGDTKNDTNIYSVRVGSKVTVSLAVFSR